jgi:hypothetical protein
LLEIETAFRYAAAQAYVICDGCEFRIVLGMPAWRAPLAAAGITAEEDRAALLIGPQRSPRSLDQG